MTKKRHFSLEQKARISAGHRKINGMPVEKDTPEWHLAVQEYVQKHKNGTMQHISGATYQNRRIEHNAAIYASHKAPGKLKHTPLWYRFVKHYIIGALLDDIARRAMHDIDDNSMLWCDVCNQYQMQSENSYNTAIDDMVLIYDTCQECGNEMQPILYDNSE